MNKLGVLGQVEGQWEKIAAVLLYKLSKDKPVTITTQDFLDFQKFVKDDNVFMTWGHKDSLELRLMTRKDAERLAEHVEAQGGGAIRS